MTGCAATPKNRVNCRLVVEGSGFLYKQVRHMTGALLAVGFGRLGPGRIEELLALGDAAAATGGCRRVLCE